MFSFVIKEFTAHISVSYLNYHFIGLENFICLDIYVLAAYIIFVNKFDSHLYDSFIQRLIFGDHFTALRSMLASCSSSV